MRCTAFLFALDHNSDSKYHVEIGESFERIQMIRVFEKKPFVQIKTIKRKRLKLHSVHISTELYFYRIQRNKFFAFFELRSLLCKIQLDIL